MNSDLQPLSSHSSSFRRMQERIAARKAWEAEHPELAADWNAALDEDEQRDRQRAVEARSRDITAAVPAHLADLGVPRDAIKALAAARDTEPVKAARKFLAATTEEARFLVLLGSKGAGKTVASALVLEWAIRESYRRVEHMVAGARVSEVSAEFVLMSTFARISGYGAEDKAWFERLCSVKALVLDDFGAEHLGAFGASMLDELLTRRHGAWLRTVITSNLAAKADGPPEKRQPTFRERIGERLFDRIRTSGIQCVAAGESLRKRGGP